MIQSPPNDPAKQAVGRAAAQLVQDGMVIGLGTGSTAACFIASLCERVRDEGLTITAVSTSSRSAEQAAAGGIAVVDPNTVTHVDLCVDGADEIDPNKNMIKGGGGALLQEKIIATMADEMVVLVDRSKQVQQLGTFPLPVEVVRFGWRSTLRQLEQLGFTGTLRGGEDSPFVTDEGHYIIDLDTSEGIKNPNPLNTGILGIVGTVETGLFIDIAGRVIIGNDDGTVEIIP